MGMLYICQKAGKKSYRNRKRARWRNDSMEGNQPGILVLKPHGAYMRQRPISPFDLYDSMMWRSEPRESSEHPEDTPHAEISLVGA